MQQTQGLAGAQAGLPAQGAATNLSSENQQVAGNAAAVRNALTGSFGAMLASQGANANTYASTYGNANAYASTYGDANTYPYANTNARGNEPHRDRSFRHLWR